MRLNLLWTLLGVLTLFTATTGCGGGDTSPPPDAGEDAGQDAGGDASPDGGDCPMGQHPDGKGGCTADVCLPNPCTQPNQTQCVDQGGSAACKCDPGTHEAGSQCLPDDTCMPGTCNSHGVCTDSGGMVACACDP